LGRLWPWMQDYGAMTRAATKTRPARAHPAARSATTPHGVPGLASSRPHPPRPIHICLNVSSSAGSASRVRRLSRGNIPYNLRLLGDAAIPWPPPADFLLLYAQWAAAKGVPLTTSNHRERATAQAFNHHPDPRRTTKSLRFNPGAISIPTRTHRARLQGIAAIVSSRRTVGEV